MDKPRKTLPINQETIDSITRSMNQAAEDVRRIVEASGPRIAAALSDMSKTVRK